MKSLIHNFFIPEPVLAEKLGPDGQFQKWFGWTKTANEIIGTDEWNNPNYHVLGDKVKNPTPY